MGTDSKYGRIWTENKDISAKEPVFLLRGQDMFASDIVSKYADVIEAFESQGQTLANRRRIKKQVADIRKFAAKMAKYKPQKFPD